MLKRARLIRLSPRILRVLQNSRKLKWVVRLTDPIMLQPGDSVYASESGTKCGVVVCSATLQDRSTELLMSVSGFLENSNSYHAREPGGPEISRLEVPYTVRESR